MTGHDERASSELATFVTPKPARYQPVKTRDLITITESDSDSDDRCPLLEDEIEADDEADENPVKTEPEEAAQQTPPNDEPETTEPFPPPPANVFEQDSLDENELSEFSRTKQRDEFRVKKRELQKLKKMERQHKRLHFYG